MQKWCTDIIALCCITFLTHHFAVTFCKFGLRNAHIGVQYSFTLTFLVLTFFFSTAWLFFFSFLFTCWCHSVDYNLRVSRRRLDVTFQKSVFGQTGYTLGVTILLKDSGLMKVALLCHGGGYLQVSSKAALHSGCCGEFKKRNLNLCNLEHLKPSLNLCCV